MDLYRMMTPAEADAHIARGETVILYYRRAYDLSWSQAAQTHRVCEVSRVRDGQPYTLRGRYMVTTPEYARRIQMMD